MKERKKVAIVIPAYNEEKRIVKTLEEYSNFLSDKKRKGELEDFELIVVCNACVDKTYQVSKNLSKKYKEIRVLDFKKGGKGFAIIEGFKDALKRENDLIGFVDADNATGVKYFYELIENIGSYGGIIASRYVRGSIILKKQRISRVLVSKVGNIIVRILFLFPYRDTQCGAKLFKRKAIEKVINKLGVSEWAFDIELLYQIEKEGFEIKELRTKWEDKTDSKLKLKKASIQVLFAILQLRISNSPFRDILKVVKPFSVIVWRIVR